MDTLGARLGHAIRLAGLDLQDVDILCDFASLGHTGQIVRGALEDPRGSTLVRLARTLGTTAEYLVDGVGPRPTAEEAGAAVKRARRRLRLNGGGRHAPKIAPQVTRRKVNGSTGDSMDRCGRAAGRP